MADITATLIPTTDKIYKYFTGFTEAYLIGKQKFLYPKNGPEILKKFRNFQAKEDDICVLTFPKTGTTWMQAIVYFLSIDVDLERSKHEVLDVVFPYVGYSMWECDRRDSFEKSVALQSPRLLKFHAHYSLLPASLVTNKCKILYVSRNVKDTITSYYHFLRSMQASLFVGSIEDFAHLFMENKVPFASYITHVKEVWEKRNEDNVYFTTYEEMKKDQEKVIEEVAQFLNKNVTKEQIKTVAELCKFDNMKQNSTLNRENWKTTGANANKQYNFMRKGVVGSWKNEMSPELIAKIDKWIYDNTEDCPELRNIL